MSMESRSTKSRRRKPPDVFPHLLTRAHKRKSFEHEREIRALTFRDPLAPEQDGFYAQARLEQVIERVYVSPSSKPWFYQLVKRILLDRHGLEGVKVLRSDLEKPPGFLEQQ